MSPQRTLAGRRRLRASVQDLSRGQDLRVPHPALGVTKTRRGCGRVVDDIHLYRDAIDD